ncbi:hypothetical protein LTS15_004156 [Exophiala xenobiotica]|nr:hypothetical protein LTS15_004156 [Exophiala xenobiotica]
MSLFLTQHVRFFCASHDPPASVKTRRQPPDEDDDASTSTTVSDVVTLETPEDLGYRQAIENSRGERKGQPQLSL